MLSLTLLHKRMDLNDPKNLLVIGRTSIISEGLLEIAIGEAERGNRVLYLASKAVDKLPEIFVDRDRSVLKRIIFTYFKSYEALAQKLMDLHNMFLTPNLLIIESLNSFFTNCSRTNTDSYLEGHAKILAVLHSTVNSFNERSNANCWSIVSFDDHEDFSQQCLTTLIDLFYFKKNCIRAADEEFIQWFEDFKLKCENRQN
ncbi:hypothetical protein Bhyg_09899, partial [Pseudolycoriella hygida]